LRDLAGQMRAVSNIIYTYFFEWAQWRAMDPWIDVLETLIRATDAYPSVEVEFDVNCSMLIATLYRRPGHSRLSACVDRVEAMLESDLDVNRKVTGATLLLTFCNLANKPERARRTISKAAKFIGQPEVTPLNKIWWNCRLTWYLNAHGYYSEVEKYIHATNALIESHGLLGLRSATQITNAHWAWAMMGLKEWNRASELVEVLEAQSQSSRSSDLVLAAESRTRLLICRGELVRALHYSSTAIEAAVATGMVWWEVLQRASAIEALAELGRHDEARTHLRRCYELVRDTSISYWETELRVIEAYMAHQEGDIGTCHELLKSAFTRADGQWRDSRLYGRVISSMCAEALSAGIESTQVRTVIQRLRLAPPSLDCEAWPWPIRIHALGRFEIVVDDRMLSFSGKAPKKPLMLLKALVAFGGCNVPEERVMDALWPDEEADAARKSLDVTVLRLRKLLGSHEAIMVSDEAIGLNPQLCWTDVCAFEHRAEAAEGRVDSGGEALELYRGNFLSTDAEEPWTAKTRERLRSKFARLTESVAVEEERAGRWEQAITCYLKGLEADDLVEPFYQGLMRCYRALGRHAEAMNAYRRLRQLLSVVLGIAPSEQTQSLARALQRDNPAQFESS
jgi:DNA-binding SARP family transcriptional activator